MNNSQVYLYPAPLLRRLAAAGYDGMLLIAMWFITTGILVPLYTNSGLPVDDFNGVLRPPVWFLQWVLFPLLLIMTWSFYAWFWLRGGQTLGMRTWRIRSRALGGGSMTLNQSVMRFFAGIVSWLLLGAGYLLVLVPPFQSLHDRISGTETLLLPKKTD